MEPSQLPKRLGGTVPDFVYIPPSPEEDAEYLANQTHASKHELWKNFIVASRKVEVVTGKWAAGGGTPELTGERDAAVKEAVEKYKALAPFIR